jgi:hypothetical protein
LRTSSTHLKLKVPLNVYKLGMICNKQSSLMSISSILHAFSYTSLSAVVTCRSSCMRSWWWVEVPPKTCRAVSRYNLCNIASCWIDIGIQLGAHYILHIGRITVKPCEYVRNIAATDLCCCLNNVMLCYLRRWRKVLRTV